LSHLTCNASSRVIVLADVVLFTKHLGSTDERNPVSASVHSLFTCGSVNNISFRCQVPTSYKACKQGACECACVGCQDFCRAFIYARKL